MLKKYKYFWITLILGFTLSVSGNLYLEKKRYLEDKAHFDELVEQRYVALNRALNNEWEILSFLTNVFQTKEFISRNEFSQLTTPILKSHPEIQALEWIPRILNDDKLLYEQRARSEWLDKFTIKERNREGNLVAVSKRPEYYPVYYVEPLKGNEAAVGFDLGSNQKRLDALKLASKENRITVTAPIRLVQDKDKQAGVLAIAPVYQKLSPSNQHDTSTVNSIDIKGYTLMVLKLGDFFAGVVTRMFDDEGLEIILEDVLSGEYLAGDRLKMAETAGAFSRVKIIQIGSHSHLNDQLVSQQPGRQWRLKIRAPSDFKHQISLFEQNLLLISGMLIGLLMALYLHNQKNQTLKIKALVNEQTVALANNLQALQESYAFNESVLDTVIDAIISIDEKGIVGRFNQAAEQLFGYSSDEVIGQNIKMLMPESYAKHHDGYLKHYAETGEKQVIGAGREVVAQHKKGLQIPIYLAVSDTGSKGRYRYTGIIHDLTEINAARAVLSSQKIAMDQHAIIATTDVKGTITGVNDKFCELSGYTKDELIGQNHRLLNSGNQDISYWKQMFRTVASGEVWNDEVRNRAKDGSFYWVDTTIVPTLGNDGKPEGYIAIRTDITHQKLMQETLTKANAELELLSKTDALTKIANRRAYEERLLQEIDSARRSDTVLALLMIDIDYFKPFNDNYGHDSGDQALSRVAAAINDSLPRATDLAARFGGEEFIVLLPTTDAKGAYNVAERIRASVKALAITHKFSQVMDSVTVSIGISSLTGDSLNEIDLLKQADDALYAAKKAGRNRCMIFEKN